MTKTITIIERYVSNRDKEALQQGGLNIVRSAPSGKELAGAVDLQNNQSIDGVKTFNDGVVLPVGTPADGNIWTSTGADGEGEWRVPIYIPKIADIITKTDDYTIQSTDNAKTIEMNLGTAKTFTIPTGMPTGMQVTFVRYGAGDVTIAASGTTLRYKNSDRKISELYGAVVAYHRGSEEWVLVGDLKA